MTNKILSLLGMARRAGRLSCGHDAAVESIVRNRAALCLCSADAADRLERELRHACTFEQKQIPFARIGVPMAVLSRAIGTKAAVVTVNDPGFAARLQALLAEGSTTGKDEDYAENEI